MVIPPSRPLTSDDIDRIDPTKSIRIAQIICIAMISGLLMFLGVSLMLSSQAPAGPIMISYVAAGFATFLILLRFVVPGFVERAMLKDLATKEVGNIDAHLFNILQTKMIIGLALLEGAGFFNLVGYMSERQWWTMIIVGILLLLMAMLFPTLPQFQSWAEDKKRELQNQF